jgi:GNAT superfamily N-acetyltransferase
MAKVKARRTHREELPGIAILRDSVASDLAAYHTRAAMLDLDMEIDPNLVHLINHDPDGFFSAVQSDETVGFAAACIRTRQCILAELWVLPQHRGKGAGEVLVSKAMAYGERSGAREFVSLVPPEPEIQGILLRHGFRPLTPVYQFEISRPSAIRLGDVLSSSLTGRVATKDLLDRRGQADVNRIDQVTRNLNREIDHTFWLKKLSMDAALVKQGARIAGYGYGGADQVGPAAGSSREAALAALGWSIKLAVDDGSETLLVRIPAPFDSAIELIQEAGGTVQSTLVLYGINVSAAFDRCALGAANLP